jgi:hypothetical protein
LLVARSLTSWLLAAVVLAGFVLVPSVWFGLAWLDRVPWPAGSSPPEFWCGVVAGAIVLFEMTLWYRKRMSRGRRRFLGIPLPRARWWMFWHVWLGLAAIPLAVVHSGMRFTGWGTASAWVMGLFLLVSASGIYGLLLQQWLPRRLLHDFPEETITAGIEVVMGGHAREARQLVTALTDEALASAPAPPGESAMPRPIRSPPAARMLREFFDGELEPYLTGRADSPLRSAGYSSVRFARLYEAVPEYAAGHVRTLERSCTTRRELDRQKRLDRWLQTWILIHYPPSVLLLVLLVWHAGAALKLW